MTSIAELWYSHESQMWDAALERYWEYVKPDNLELERQMDALNLDRIQQMDAQEWYEFLKSEYFRWKYTASNRYTTTVGRLQQYVQDGTLGELFQIKERLLSLNPMDIHQGLATACEINGLGTAGASGLLALMYPQCFATVDQFVVKALWKVPDLPETADLSRMNPQALTLRDGVVLIGIMQRKATENNQQFRTSTWTPRKIDKILWTYGRQENPHRDQPRQVPD
jgi:hypothetical protein